VIEVTKGKAYSRKNNNHPSLPGWRINFKWGQKNGDCSVPQMVEAVIGAAGGTLSMVGVCFRGGGLFPCPVLLCQSPPCGVATGTAKCRTRK